MRCSRPVGATGAARAGYPARAAALLVGLIVGGCAVPQPDPPRAAPPPDPSCAAFERYGDLSGTSISLVETATDGGPRIGGYAEFARCTGSRIAHRRVASVAERLTAGDRPDLGYLPDAATLAELVRRTGAVIPAPPPVAANVATFYPETYRAAGSVDGTLYGSPVDGSVTSLVWYSPKVFGARGYRVPQNWDELLALTARITADGQVPWCAGAAAGPATGAPLVDALEDTLLSTAGPEVFDAWVAHTIPTDAPQVIAALDELGSILRNPAEVNAGFGDPASIAATPVSDAGLPVLSGRCLLHRQADRYAAAWPDSTTIVADGDVFAFRVPPRTPDGGTALVSGGFAVAFTDRREVAALHAYLSTADAAQAMGRNLGPGWLSPNSGLDRAALSGPLERLALGVLQDPRITLRYDGSDRMPPEVGSGSLPRALTAWVTGTPAADALATAEAAWPR